MGNIYGNKFLFRTTFEEAIDATGHGKFNYLVLVTCGLVLLYTYTESLGTGFMIPAAQSDLHLSVSQKGLVNAATFIGVVATAVMWGYLSDNYGRRKVMLPALAFNLLTSLASSLSQKFIHLFLLRILTGCLVSASSATVFAYLGELTSNSHRARFMALGSLFISLSLIKLPALAWLIITHKWSFAIGSFHIGSWRIFMWSWYVTGLTAFIIMIFLPESPRFLFSSYGPDYALPVLRMMYAINNNKLPSDFPITKIYESPAVVHQHGLKVTLRNLEHMFHPPLLRCMLISHFCMFMAFVMCSGLYTWMPEILNETLDYATSAMTICQIMEAKYEAETKLEVPKERVMNSYLYPVTITMGIISTIGYVLVAIFVNIFGKKKMYWILVFCGTAMLMGAVLVPMPPVAVGLYITGLILGIAPSVLAAIAVEVFPTSVRALALCTLYMMGRLGAACGAMLLGYGIPKHCIIVIVGANLSIAASGFLFCLWPDPADVRRVMEARGFVY